MPQLVECRARDHALNPSERAVRSQAESVLRQSQPHPAAAALHRGSEGAIVDDLVANRGDSASLGERLGTNQDAASRRGGGLAPGVTNPLRRIQHKEEE